MNIQTHTSFHNTNNSQGVTLEKAEATCKNQEERIYKYFHASPEHKYTAEDVWKTLYQNSLVPLTSVRRAISNLKEEKKLYQTGEQVIGMYGKRISVWKLRTDNNPQLKLI